jgi:hypothetical protein
MQVSFHPFLSKNSTSISFGKKEVGPYYWVGYCQNGINYFAGQTFVTPEAGLLKRISLFPSIVYGNTDATLTVYEFDRVNHTWKQRCAEVKRFVSKAMEGQWTDFELPRLQVNKNGSYGFKLSCNGGGMMAIAECPWNNFNPYREGEEWIGSSQLIEGNFYKDFDLAFEGEIETQ